MVAGMALAWHRLRSRGEAGHGWHQLMSRVVASGMDRPDQFILVPVHTGSSSYWFQSY